jgi:aerobic C4-dicarboxylate transport protein
MSMPLNFPQRQQHPHLYRQVIIAIFLGVLLGYFFPETATAMKPLGDGFIKLIKMLIAPIVFCTVVTGIAGIQDIEKIGRVGWKTLVYFEVASTFALILGLVVIHLLKPGEGMNIDINTLDTKNIAAYTVHANAPHTLVEFLLNIIPSSVVDAFAKGETLQVLLLSLLFGFSLAAMKETGTEVVTLIHKMSCVLLGIIQTIMKLAPIGAFGAMAFTIGKYGIASLLPLLTLMGGFYLTCILFVFGVLGIVGQITGFNIIKLLFYIKEELIIVLGTSSSESALPFIMVKLEKLGCSKSIVGLVVPTGYSFNLDGTSIYLTMAALFIAQATNTSLTLMQELSLLGVLLLTSKGGAAVTGGGLIVLAATLSAFPVIPVQGLALILGIHRFMSEAMSLTNLVGNSVATIVAAKWENELDEIQMNIVLNQYKL